jgi:hypothetical protein
VETPSASSMRSPSADLLMESRADREESLGGKEVVVLSVTSSFSFHNFSLSVTFAVSTLSPAAPVTFAFACSAANCLWASAAATAFFSLSSSTTAAATDGEVMSWKKNLFRCRKETISLRVRSRFCRPPANTPSRMSPASLTNVVLLREEEEDLLRFLLVCCCCFRCKDGTEITFEFSMCFNDVDVRHNGSLSSDCGVGANFDFERFVCWTDDAGDAVSDDVATSNRRKQATDKMTAGVEAGRTTDDDHPRGIFITLMSSVRGLVCFFCPPSTSRRRRRRRHFVSQFSRSSRSPN